jgi:hypothetical protein
MNLFASQSCCLSVEEILRALHALRMTHDQNPSIHDVSSQCAQSLSLPETLNSTYGPRLIPFNSLSSMYYVLGTETYYGLLQIAHVLWADLKVGKDEKAPRHDSSDNPHQD